MAVGPPEAPPQEQFLCHTAKTALELPDKCDKRLKALTWPPISPDPNLIKDPLDTFDTQGPNPATHRTQRIHYHAMVPDATGPPEILFPCLNSSKRLWIVILFLSSQILDFQGLTGQSSIRLLPWPQDCYHLCPYGACKHCESYDVEVPTQTYTMHKDSRKNQNFPNELGAIDGQHHHTSTTIVLKQELKYKKTFFIKVLLVVDHRFRAI